MSAAPTKLAALRQLLAERFPAAARAPARTLRTAIPAIDEVTGGGLPLGAITEIVCAAPSCGSQLLLTQLLAVTRLTRTRVGLIDATDAFDPDSHPADLLAHLVWVRCPANSSTTALALQAADLLARDANLGLVLLDLRYAPTADLGRIPGPQWYRFQRAIESTDLALVVFTPRPSVPSAQLRLLLNVSHSVAALEVDRPLLTASLEPTLHRQRLPTSMTG
jgi:hypothetical protein